MGNWKRKLRSWRANRGGVMVVIEEKISTLDKLKTRGRVQPFQIKLRDPNGAWARKGGAKTLEEAKKKGDRLLLMS